MWLDLVRIHTSIDIALLCFSLKPPIAAAAYLFVTESCKHLKIYDKWPQLLIQNLWITLHIKGIVSILVLTRQRNQKNAARRQRAWQPWYPQRRSFHSQRMHQQLSILGAQSSQRRHCNINKRVKGCRVSAIPKPIWHGKFERSEPACQKGWSQDCHQRCKRSHKLNYWWECSLYRWT